MVKLSFASTGINYSLKYIKKKQYFKLNINISQITVRTVFDIFDQIHNVLVSSMHSLLNFKKILWP